MSALEAARPHGYLVLDGLKQMLVEANATFDVEEQHMVLTSVALWRMQLCRLLVLQRSQDDAIGSCDGV
tara:strand:+ start:11262 stop:11468 length:207 start_codon:yes stop_codon:yes gene_type:complete